MPPGVPRLSFCLLEDYNDLMRVSLQFSNYSSSYDAVTRLSTSLITSQLWSQKKIGFPWDYLKWADLSKNSSYVLSIQTFNYYNQSSPLYSLYIQTARELLHSRNYFCDLNVIL